MTWHTLDDWLTGEILYHTDLNQILVGMDHNRAHHSVRTSINHLGTLDGSATSASPGSFNLYVYISGNGQTEALLATESAVDLSSAKTSDEVAGTTLDALRNIDISSYGDDEFYVIYLRYGDLTNYSEMPIDYRFYKHEDDEYISVFGTYYRTGTAPAYTLHGTNPATVIHRESKSAWTT